MFSTIWLPVVSSHTISGSVSVLLPEPSDSTDLEASSWIASEAEMKIESSGRLGLRRNINGGMSAVTWLMIISESMDPVRPRELTPL